MLLGGDTAGVTSPIYTSYFCDTTAWSTSAFQLETETITTTSTSTPTLPEQISPSPPLVSPHTTVPVHDEDPAGGATPDVAHKSKTTAIAGGVGGGVGGAALIAAVIVGVLVRRKKRERKEQVPEVNT